jgi:hypothetical protein
MKKTGMDSMACGANGWKRGLPGQICLINVPEPEHKVGEASCPTPDRADTYAGGGMVRAYSTPRQTGGSATILRGNKPGADFQLRVFRPKRVLLLSETEKLIQLAANLPDLELHGQDHDHKKQRND